MGSDVARLLEKALIDAICEGADAADQHSEAYARVDCRIALPTGELGKIA